MTSEQTATPAPFIVERQFEMRPGLSRLDGPLCESDPVLLEQARVQVQRALALDRLPLGLWQTPGMSQALSEAAELIGQGGAGGPLGEAGTDRLDLSREPASLLLKLRLSVPDDLVLMAPLEGDDEGARAVAMAVAMPTGWDPAAKLGLDFGQIHQPVPDAPVLVNGAAQLGAMILSGGPYRRHVWTLSDNPRLGQHPSDQQRSGRGTGDGVWYRVERQTTIGLPVSGYCLFLIRVWHVPLAQVLQADEQRAGILCDALRSMSDAVVDYKNLRALRVRVLEELAT